MSKVNPVESIARVLCNFVGGDLKGLQRLQDNINLDNLEFPDEVPTGIRNTKFVTGVAKNILVDDGNAARAAFEARAQEMTEEHRTAPIAFDPGTSDSDFTASDTDDPGYEIPKEDDTPLNLAVNDGGDEDALANMLTEDTPPDIKTTSAKPKKKERVFTCPKVINFLKSESTQKVKIPAHIPLILEAETEINGIKVKQNGDELELVASKSFKGEKEIRVLGQEVGNTIFGIKIRCTYTKRWHKLW